LPMQVKLMKNQSNNGEKTISLDYLARVEGEGALYLQVDKGKVKTAELKIFEPPRFFESFLVGRSYLEAPDITARICGICPVAYQMSSVHAMEQICGIQIDPEIRELRRLLYCGEWIESHTLHMFMLHAPDFLGYPDVIELAKDHRELVENALKLKKVGNDIMNLLGGREIHPINIRVGGFYRIPEKETLLALLPRLYEAKTIIKEAAKVIAGLEFPDITYEYEFVALSHPGEYPMNEGRLISNKGLGIDIKDYEDHFHEEHLERSNALHSYLEDRRSYLTGPLARYALNFEKLDPETRKLAKANGLKSVCNNPFKSILIRALETHYACVEAIRILEHYQEPALHHIETKPKKGTGYGCTEAPRGILYHRYELDNNGKILSAKIVAPTSQNQKIMEDDLVRVATKYMHLDEDDLTHKCEQAIRNYDPCISCATHFLNLKLEEV